MPTGHTMRLTSARKKLTQTKVCHLKAINKLITMRRHWLVCKVCYWLTDLHLVKRTWTIASLDPIDCKGHVFTVIWVYHDWGNSHVFKYLVYATSIPKLPVPLCCMSFSRPDTLSIWQADEPVQILCILSMPIYSLGKLETGMILSCLSLFVVFCLLFMVWNMIIYLAQNGLPKPNSRNKIHVLANFCFWISFIITYHWESLKI